MWAALALPDQPSDECHERNRKYHNHPGGLSLPLAQALYLGDELHLRGGQAFNGFQRHDLLLTPLGEHGLRDVDLTAGINSRFSLVLFALLEQRTRGFDRLRRCLDDITPRE